MFKRFWYVYRDIKNGIRNLRYWLPIIWGNRNWDYYYLFAILHHKMRAMVRVWENNDVYIGQEKDLKHMKICYNLLDRIIKNEYPQYRADIKTNRTYFFMNDYLLQQDINLLCKLIAKHSQKWWN